jgi:PAS domain S-box-containing protein
MRLRRSKGLQGRLVGPLAAALTIAVVLGLFLRIGADTNDIAPIAMRAEADYLRLSEALADFVVDPSSESRARFNGRLKAFQNGLVSLVEPLRDEPGEWGRQLHYLVARLPKISADAAALSGGDREAYRELRRELELFREPLREMALPAMSNGASGVYSRATHQALGESALWFAVFAVAIVALLVVAVRARRALSEIRRSAVGTEHELETVKSQLADVIENLSDGVALFDAAERLVLANERYRSIQRPIAHVIAPGCGHEEILRAAIDRDVFRIDGGSQEWLDRLLQQCRDSMGPVELPLTSGRTVMLSGRRTPQGGLVVILTDITEKRQAERVLESRLAAFESSLDGLAIVDSEGRLVYANRSYALMHGWPERDGCLGLPWAAAYDADERERFEEDVLPDLRTAGVWRGEAIGLTADGATFPQELTLRLLEDGGIVCVVRDTTERHRADEERGRLREQFHLAQRSEALGRLAGGIAHDFNNILGVIMGLADLCLIELPAEDPVRGRIDRIVRAGLRAKDLIEQILAFSRQSRGEPTVIDLGDNLNVVLEILRATVPSTIDIVASVARSRCFVLADRSQIEQVIMNLCVNAMHAIGSGQGRIDIWLETVDGRDVITHDLPPAAIRDRSTAGYVQCGDDGRTNVLWMSTPAPCSLIRLSVRDTGCGMDVETLREIFQPFFTTKPAGTGTGLGLAAVHGIVTSHGGAIRVESALGQGTQLDVFLPAAQGSAEPIKDEEEAIVTGNRRGRILVVDDEVDLAAVVSAKLQNLGHDAVECHNPHKAWTLFRNDPHGFDLLVTDQTMPGMTGDELAAQIREVRPDLPVIICSGYAARVSESRMRELGVVALLSKPVTTPTLARAVAQALDQDNAVAALAMRVVA